MKLLNMAILKSPFDVALIALIAIAAVYAFALIDPFGVAQGGASSEG